MKEDYLNRNVFYGLENLNSGFDADSIKYFSESDFRIVLERVEKLGIGVMGIEPWKNGEFYDVLTCEDFNRTPEDSCWYTKALKRFTLRDSNLQYAATYLIPETLLK